MRRVGFLVYKDHVIMCGDVINSARCWSRRGYGADVFSFDTGRFPAPSLEDGKVRFILHRTLYGRLLPAVQRWKSRRRQKNGEERPGESSAPPSSRLRGPLRPAASLLRSLQSVEYLLFVLFRLLRGRYCLVVAFDTPGLLAARAVRLLKGTPYVYHSRELLLGGDVKGLSEKIEKWAERRCHRRASFTIIQDDTRAGLLSSDNAVPRDSFLIVPNSPLGEYSGGGRDGITERLGLEPGTKVVLYAGTVAGENMVLEMIESIPGWPEGTVLVIHGDVETGYRPLLEEAAGRLGGRVRFSSPDIQPDDLDDFFAGAAAGIAFYRPINDNFRYVGQAAGKIFNFMKVGVPVICNDLPGMTELIEESGAGRTVPEAALIGPALGGILSDLESYRERCRSAFRRYEFGRSYDGIIDAVEPLLNEKP